MAARYNTARTTLLEAYDRIENVGVRWSLPGGFQRAEVTVRVRSKFDAARAYFRHPGDGFAILDSYLDTPIVDGWVYEVVPDGNFVHYIIGGAWKRHFERWEADAPAVTDDTDVVIKTALTNHVPAVNTDQSHIDATSIDIGSSYKLDPWTGERPGDIINEILRIGNTSNQTVDYWLVPAPLNGLYPQLPLPYLAGRNPSAADWQVSRRDLKHLTMSRHLWDLANSIGIYYIPSTTLDTAEAAGQTVLGVTATTGFAADDEVEIDLDNNTTWKTTIASVSAGVSITVNDALPSAAASGNLVRNGNITGSGFLTDATSQADYWASVIRDVQRGMDATQAAQYQQAYSDRFANPVPQAAFTIGAGRIKDGNGARWPLWRMLINPGYIRINDLFPGLGLFAVTVDNLTTFRITALDYDYKSNTMRVTPDNTDQRIDVILGQVAAGVGQIISREDAVTTGG